VVRRPRRHEPPAPDAVGQGGVLAEGDLVGAAQERAVPHRDLPYLLRLKQSANADGAIRLQCPAAGTSPSVTCPRFDRLHQRGPSRPTAVDLTDARQRAAHPAAKPRVRPRPLTTRPANGRRSATSRASSCAPATSATSTSSGRICLTSAPRGEGRTPLPGR
jgi:hypothetical protein